MLNFNAPEALHFGAVRTQAMRSDYSLNALISLAPRKCAHRVIQFLPRITGWIGIPESFA
jgi:hypothetical protein